MASRLKRQSSSTQVFSLSFSNYFHGTDHSNFIYLSSGSAVYYSSLAPSNGVQLHHPLPIPNLNPILIPFPKFSRMQSLLTLLTLFRPLYETIIPNEYNTAQLLSAFLAGCPAIIGTARAIIEAHTTNKSNFKLSGIERGAGDVVYAYVRASDQFSFIDMAQCYLENHFESLKVTFATLYSEMRPCTEQSLRITGYSAGWL